jgi:hypothetical protein
MPNVDVFVSISLYFTTKITLWVSVNIGGLH